MLAKAYRVVRMDFAWNSIEVAGACGTYNFSQYDNLLAEMQSASLRPYWILDYQDSACYPSPGSSCSTPACITGYGNLAAAAAAHFGHNNIIWESVNEPNGMGQDNSSTIAALIHAAGSHFLAAGETWVGPTTAGIDFPYINQTFAAGALQWLTAVSVHPYRSGPPESATADLLALSALITSYVPGGKPILSGEWGYTSAMKPCDYGNRVQSQTQGKYVPRMWLSALLAGAEVMISYDWKNDGPNISNCEDNFGSVTSSFQPKPSYLAALAAQTSVGNAATFLGRVPAAVHAPASWNLTSDSAFVLAFAGGSLAQPTAFAVWTNVTTCMASASPGTRTACGAATVDEMGCLALGCCFDEDLPANATGVPACYVALPAPVQPGVCPDVGRTDCGYNGIGHDECVNTRGCCWDSSPDPSGPQCFFHDNQGATGPVNVSFPVAPAPADACFSVLDVFGFSRGSVCAAGGFLSLAATDGPTYLL